ncbi:hypothetical protein OG884_33455 [Streptosporangium sp. NBC_01755]|uniref:hypothetical protein n=1 Tax=Streptosporangium sp. NBC_01755 TaxID=2975949 RepID=UPI002DDA3843|nr:hypothetical protein [Streptosporangium sp. NBC_01755]WSC99663.1 hypothetical protein OG884_33455 [Streptosporangium sp. NBC_01755]
MRPRSTPNCSSSAAPISGSIYRFDDEMLVNVHVYGILAAYTPTRPIEEDDL